MSQTSSFNDGRRCNVQLRRLSKIRSGITLVYIDASSSLASINNDERIRLANAYSHCNILQYTSLLKFSKYLKQARSYEYIIILLTIDNLNIANDGISGICINQIGQYHQVQSIIIIYRSPRINRDDKIYLFKEVKKKTDKLVGIHNDYQSASSHLQKLIAEVEELDDGALCTFNGRNKSLNDARENFLEVLSTQSFRGSFIYLPISFFFDIHRM